MKTLEIDLSLQEINVFDIQKPKIELLNKNFIFGKNGSGKSTLTELIKKNYCDDFDIRIFTGFDGVLINEKLNAVVLGEENEEISKKIESIDSELERLNNNINNIQRELISLGHITVVDATGLTEHSLLKEKKELLNKKKKKILDLEKFYVSQAKFIKDSYQNYIKDINYNKSKFESDLLTAEELDENELDENEQILKENHKEINLNIQLPMINIEQILENTNVLLKKSVVESFSIEELSGNDKKKEFAKDGLLLHEVNDKCSFCGNIVADKRIDKLNRYFSSKDIEIFQEEINYFQKNTIDLNIKKLEKIDEINENRFFNYFTEDIKKLNEKIKEKKEKYFKVLYEVEKTINEKRNTLFSSMEPLKIEKISNFTEENLMINEIIEKHTDYNKQLQSKQYKAIKKLRLHYVAIAKKYKEDYKKGWKGYEIEKYDLDELKRKFEEKDKELQEKIDSLLGDGKNFSEDTLNYIKTKKFKLEQDKKYFLSETRNSSILAARINEKLSCFGKNNLKLELIQDNENIEHYKIKDGYGLRDIQKLSTGERNIIAFLYFMEELEVSESLKNKIIILDDPMNSNDDSMQYLIITEIQKLYQGKYEQRFDNQKDYFLCLTHNVHFYLNVQPQGNFKEKVKNLSKPEGKLIEKSKYDKNGFFWLENKTFKRISSAKEDINTHYEHLWLELENLYKQNMLNSMLNSMRRIIETYLHFNKINPDKFYKNYEEHRKLFNVNSHAIDDLTAEVIGKDKDRILEMFRQIFDGNGALSHFENYKNRWEL